MMPVRIVTPNRLFIVILTAAFISAVNIVINSTNTEYASFDQFYLERVLQGPVLQDDPVLIAWVKNQLVPPSKKPLNIDFHFSGINSNEEDGSFFSPSQDFILSKVEEILGDKIESGGTFVEAGAYNGEFLSNTLSLEYSFGWSGILVEPHPTFFNQLLSKNRKSWAINACLSIKPWPSKEIFASVYGDPSTHHLYNGLVTNATVEKDVNLASSGLIKYANSKNKIAEKILVQCLPLYTILRALSMTHVDFFSLDVERAEMGILDTIPWEKVSFSILAIEHKSSDELKAFLLPKGYIHVESLFEDHIFVNKKLHFYPNNTEESSRKDRITSKGKLRRRGRKPHFIKNN